MIPDQFLQELKYRSDIEQIIGSYVNLRRRGRTLSGLCPFHSEKSPSFTVYPENQSFYCFGCGAGGDVISFIRRIENLDYMESIRFLAQRAGMQVPEEAGDDRSARLRKRILELNRDAARYFHRNLMSEAGRPGRAGPPRSSGCGGSSGRHPGLAPIFVFSAGRSGHLPPPPAPASRPAGPKSGWTPCSPGSLSAG